MKTLRNSSLITLAVVALALLVAAPVAKADIVQVVGNTYTPTDYSGADFGTFNLFDSNLGTLNSVTLTFSGGITGTLQFKNGGSSPANISGTDNGTFTLSGTNSYINSLFATPLTVVSSAATDTGLAAGATGPVHPVSGNNSTAALAVNSADFAIFEAAGGGTSADDLFDLSATGGDSVTGGNGNGSATYTMNAGGAVVIDYNYTPNGGPSPVPEPGTLSLFGTGLLGLAGMLRSRFSKAS
jgi:hypothetical protein